MTAPTAVSPLDAGALLDHGRWSRYQVWLIIATALTIIVDGIDNQLLPNALPALIREWGVTRAGFTTALAVGPIGMMFGGVLGGFLGDRIGRRPALVLSVLWFGILSLGIAFVDSVSMLALLRFLTGVGLGGAMPNAATLASEYAPVRQRPVAVTLTIVCIPLGGALAGELAARLIPIYGWASLFAVGGAVPIVLALMLWRLLPESPKFLAGHPQRWNELCRLLRRCGHPVADGTAFAQPHAPVQSHAVGQLFDGGLGRDTLALWVAFFFGLMVNYVVVLLLPALLSGPGIGFSQPAASRALAMSNYGGVIGAVLGALVIQRVGSRLAMLGMSAGAVGGGLLLARTPLDPGNPTRLLIGLLLTGGLVNGVQTTMYALAAHVYPTRMRGMGVGTAVAMGRIGNAVAAYAGSAAIDRGGAAGYFTLWSWLMVVVFGALAAMSRHVRPASRPAPDAQ